MEKTQQVKVKFMKWNTYVYGNISNVRRGARPDSWVSKAIWQNEGQYPLKNSSTMADTRGEKH